jgi:hypothetical protein
MGKNTGTLQRRGLDQKKFTDNLRLARNAWGSSNFFVQWRCWLKPIGLLCNKYLCSQRSEFVFSPFYPSNTDDYLESRNLLELSMGIGIVDVESGFTIRILEPKYSAEPFFWISAANSFAKLFCI